jgi:tricarballylate dehydrogenase
MNPAMADKSSTTDCDVLVVGAGNAALCAALAAKEQGAARVIVLERAPEAERGGNTAFTAGGFRVAYNNLDQLLELLPDLSEEEKRSTDFGTYTEDQYFEDVGRVTEYRTDPDMVELLVRRSHATLLWMRGKGVRLVPMYGRQAFKVDGRFKFWGGLTVEAWGGGPGLIDALHGAVRRENIEVCYGARAISLLSGDSGVHGATVRAAGTTTDLTASAVVLASGGFEANAEWRARYLGQNWDLARVRGTRFNTGDGIRMALEAGAMPFGHWSGCHAVGWDRNAPPFGDLAVGDGFQKHSYPLGIMLNGRGRRFVDEGADFRNYTYAKYGRAILEQPGQFAWQIFDHKVAHLLRDEYRIRQVTKVTADSLEDLVRRLDDVDADAALAEINAYNDAVDRSIPFNPNIKDGRCTRGLAVPKSNWANPLDEAPFLAFAVTCGITFTFGGLRITREGEVVDTESKVIPGLYAAGELVGGLFYFNYAGGSGLMAGSVFGKIAGTSAGKFATSTVSH